MSNKLTIDVSKEGLTIDVGQTEPAELPPASDVRLGVDRGDGVLGTLQDYSEPTLEDSVIELHQGDHCLKPWKTREDQTGKTITLVVFDKHDPSIVNGRLAGAVDSPSEVSVFIDSEELSELTFCGCPPVAELAFALVAVVGTTEKTLERGRVYVYARPEL